MEPLTPAQKELYDWLVKFINENHYSPTIRQMMRAMGLRSPAPIQARLERLQTKGYVTWTEGKARTTQILQQHKPGIVIKGAIAAGGLVEPFVDEETIFELPQILDGNEYYALKVDGNGLVSEAIANEDIAIVRRISPEERVKNGETVAVNVKGYGYAIRGYKVEGEMIILESLKQDETWKLPTESVEIQGVFVGIWRNN